MILSGDASQRAVELEALVKAGKLPAEDRDEIDKFAAFLADRKNLPAGTTWSEWYDKHYGPEPARGE